MGGACSNLAQLGNPCELGPCITSAVMPPKTTASASVQAILKLAKNTHFNGKPVSSVFLKLFINPEGFTKEMYKFVIKQYSISKKAQVYEYERFKSALDAMAYELMIYGSLIQPIVAQRLCPFFTTVYSTGFQCTFEDVAALVGEGNQSQLMLAVGQTLVREPQLGVTLKHSSVDLRRFRFCAIVSQLSERTTLRTFLEKSIVTEKASLTTWFKVMFQVAYALYVLQLAGVAHNDLHSGNVLVNTLPSPITYVLCAGLQDPVYYTFKTNITVQVFDFDRSSFTPYRNAFITQAAINFYSSRHQVVETQDFYRLIYSLMYSFYKTPKALNQAILPLLDMVYKDEDLKARTRQLTDNTNFLTYKGKELPAEFFTGLQPMRSVLAELAEKARIAVTKTRPEPVDNEEFYLVDASFFKNGVVKTATVRDALDQAAFTGRNKEEVESVTTTTAVEKEAKGGVVVEPERLRNAEVELTQDEYDLHQLLYFTVK